MLRSTYFTKDPKIVAKGLVGRNLVRKLNDELYKVQIIETGAYRGKGRRVHDKGFEYYPGTIHLWPTRGYRILTISAYTDVPSLIAIRRVMVKKALPTDPIRTLSPGKVTRELMIDDEFEEVSIAGKYLWIEGRKAKDSQISHISPFRKVLPKNCLGYYRLKI